MYLSHHGIKGQKWGTRNGPPYPLNEEGKRNFRYNKTIREAKDAGDIIKKCSSYSVGGLSTMMTSSGEQFVSGLMHGHDFDWQEVNIDKYTGEAVSTAKLHKGHEGLASFDYSFEDGLIRSDQLSKINPDFGNAGTTQNCAKCAATLELAYQGYGGFIAGRQTYPSSSNANEYWFDGAKEVGYSSPSIANSYLSNYGPGASGTLSMQYPQDRGGGGHALHWRVSDSGKLRIEDGQNGLSFSSIMDANDYYGFNGGEVSTYRLDNCTPNWEHMSSDSVVRGHTINDVVRNRFSGKVVSRW